MSAENNLHDKHRGGVNLCTGVLIVILFILLWVGSGTAIYYALPNWQERGMFGDMFGSINSLFSGLALLGVVAALWFQQRELDDGARAQEQTIQALIQQAEVLKLTAKLNALSAKAHVFSEDISRRRSSGSSSKSSGMERAEKELDEILRKISELESKL